MPRNIFITGGAASGKAAWAVEYYRHCGEATFVTLYNDIEEKVRLCIDKSTEEGVKWEIVRQDGSPADVLSFEKPFYVIDGVPEYTAALLSAAAEGGEISDEAAAKVKSAVLGDFAALIARAAEEGCNLVIISLEAGFSPEPAGSITRAFRDILCTANSTIAALSDEVYLSVSGIQMKIK